MKIEAVILQAPRPSPLQWSHAPARYALATKDFFSFGIFLFRYMRDVGFLNRQTELVVHMQRNETSLFIMGYKFRQFI